MGRLGLVVDLDSGTKLSMDQRPQGLASGHELLVGRVLPATELPLLRPSRICAVSSDDKPRASGVRGPLSVHNGGAVYSAINVTRVTGSGGEEA
jgi:hypothetical protein